MLNKQDGKKTYYLHAIDIMEGWQYQDCGTELVCFVHEHLNTLGYYKMILLTNKHNSSAYRSYEKVGEICKVPYDDIVFTFKLCSIVLNKSRLGV